MAGTLWQAEFYGFPLYFRLEHRKDEIVVIFSIRQSKNGKLTIEYEHPPRRIPELEELIASDNYSGNLDGKVLSLEQLPEKYMEKLFQRYLFGKKSPFRKDDGDVTSYRMKYSDLTLGVMLTAEKEYLLNGYLENGEKKLKSSVDDDARAIKKLLQHEGLTRWMDVTPRQCNHWLNRETQHSIVACVRIMRRLELRLIQKNVADPDVKWDSFDSENLRRPRQNYRHLVRANIVQTMLTYGQIAQLVEQFVTCESSKHVTGIDMALLLKLTLGLSEGEICGLDIHDFEYLRDYKTRLTVNIVKVYERQEGDRNCRLQILKEDSFQRRKLPLPSQVERCFQAMLTQRNAHASEYLVRSQSNAHRRMSPQILRKELIKRILAIFPALGMNSVDYAFKVDMTLLSNTAFIELKKSGCEEEELRFIQGKQPLAVSAVSYSDFLNEAELNKIGALQERWLNRVFSFSKASSPFLAGALRKKDDQVLLQTSEIKKCTNAEITISVQIKNQDYIPEEGINLELSALHGMNGSITYVC